MAGNAFGKLFRITTFGESHGGAVGVLIDGVRPNLPISMEMIQRDLDRRRPGQSKVTTSRNEADRVQVLSGIFKGKTLGTPICLIVWNKDQNPGAYKKIKDVFRPGHASYTYLSKFGIQDFRGGGRSSGRETIGRVGAGGIAKQILAKRGVVIRAYTLEAGGIRAKTINLNEIERNPMRAPDAAAAAKMIRKVLKVKAEGDSVGGIVEAVVKNCPIGLGDPVFDKLEADLAKALLSIPALKGFEIGSGFRAARMKGSEHNDEFFRERKTGRIRTRTNFAGGILGGISNGEDIVVRVAVKPPSSIPKTQRTVDTSGAARTISVEGRHDPCLCPRVVPVVESMIALVLAEHLLRQRMVQKTNALRTLRDNIDLTDSMIVTLLSYRQDLVREVGKRKRQGGLPIPDPRREKDILSSILSMADEARLDPKFLRHMYDAIFEHSRAVQRTV